MSAAQESTLNLLMGELERTKTDLGEFVRYAQLLEAEVCRCRPQMHEGEYMHEGSCLVADIQMKAFACTIDHGDDRISHNLCPGPHPKKGLHA